MWKRDTKTWTVREVEGNPWPDKDSEGDKCYLNTHFDNEDAAWASLEAEAKAGLSLAIGNLNQARKQIKRLKEVVINSARALNRVTDAINSRTTPNEAGRE